ncbi:MAG: AMP-binding protein [Acidimicrobiales bacterium]|jgi:acyl-CoA synthetase (AMP-forming)/AMP-acid ligase II
MKELVGSRVLLPAFERFAEADAVHDGAYDATFARHANRVLRLANAMKNELGLTKSDRFAVMAANSHEFLELYHAAFLGAGIINPLNLRLAGRELQTILADSGTEVVFVDSLFAEHLLRNIAGVRADLALKRVVLIGDRDVPHDFAYEDLVEHGHPVPPDEAEEDDPVVLMYTGGTTGLPKGALLDHRAEMLNLYHVGLTVDMPPGRVYLHQTPMFHAASMAAVIGIPATGSKSVMLPLFEPGAMLDLVEQHQVDWTVMVPTMVAMMMNHPEFKPERLASLRDLVYGASPMPLKLLQRVQDTLPDLRLWQGYGMTECSSILTFLTPQDHRGGGDRLRSAGRPPLGVTISVQDKGGNALGTHEQGEVCARGGNFMREYWNRPKETEKVFEEGWYHTGDMGHLDEDGYLYLVDRVKDMIVTGGENVYSIEVENALSTHPAVADVAVIGIPHETWGEQVHAIVVLKPGASATAEDLQEHARATIARFKVPKSVEFRTDPLPLSGAMKPLKRDLRAPYWEGHESRI